MELSLPLETYQMARSQSYSQTFSVNGPQDSQFYNCYKINFSFHLLFFKDYIQGSIHIERKRKISKKYFALRSLQWGFQGRVRFWKIW